MKGIKRNYLSMSLVISKRNIHTSLSANEFTVGDYFKRFFKAYCGDKISSQILTLAIDYTIMGI